MNIVSTVRCEQCGLNIYVEDADIGRDIACSNCRTHYAISRQQRTVVASRKSPREASLRCRCPYCREDICVGALKCKHCGEYLDQPAVHHIDERHRAEGGESAGVNTVPSHPTATCPGCRAALSPADRFCRKCGSALPVGAAFAPRPDLLREADNARGRVPTEIIRKSTPPVRSHKRSSPEQIAIEASGACVLRDGGEAVLPAATSNTAHRGVIGRSVAGWILLLLQWATLYNGGDSHDGLILHALERGHLGSALGGLLGGSLLALVALILGLGIRGHPAGHVLKATACITIALVFFLV
jgi:DNA-directed RNA polymerase subunit M/transcription elongation factor TFIIS